MTITAEPPVRTIDRGVEFLERARGAAKVIEAEANAIEEAATITRPVYEALADAGLFWILVPQEYGGAGLDIVSAFKVIQEIARADGSTGWAFMANSCSTGVAVGFMESGGAKEIFDSPDPGITAGMVVPTGSATRVDGGYSVTGRFQFASGSAHASWIGVGFVVNDEQGNPIIVDDAGTPDCRIGFVPRDQVEFLGNWNVMGMVGTGSYDYKIENCFVPDRHTMETFSTTPVRPEPVYQLGLLGIGVGGHAPVALGLAERALQEIVGIVANKVRPGYPTVVGDSDLFPNFAHYVAAKHGVTGLARTASNELGQYRIRCNSIHPTSVLTDMIDHEAMYKLFRPDLEHPTHEDFREACQTGMNVLPIPWLDPLDISNAVVWLASDAARYVTGIALPIDAGALSKV